jgi:SAM-dependent methyltransferase
MWRRNGKMHRDYLENLAVISKHPREYLSSFLSNKKECPICENRFGGVLPGGISNIDHDSDYFDIIICCHVLEHVPDDRKAMKELFRVLKPKGQAILQVPISYALETFEDTTIQTPEARFAAYGQTDHVRLYGSDYSDKLKSVGFKVNYFTNLSKNDNYGLIKDEKLFISSKE